MELTTDRSEIRRFLGYGKQPLDEHTEAIMEECILRLQEIAVPRFCQDVFPVSILEERLVRLGPLEVPGRDLARNLCGCEKAVLFGATLGTQVDLAISRYAVCEVTKAYVMQAVAASAVEQFCNKIQNSAREAMRQEGWHDRPRFSPGYGDFPLSFQKDIVRLLNASKKIGLTVTEDCLLAPLKSVTAVIGFSRTPRLCERNECDLCNRSDCLYRLNA